MTSSVGRVSAVFREPSGSSLAADASSGQEVLTVEDGSDFNEAGGQILLEDGTVLTYLSANVETGLITLSAPLVADVWIQGDVLGDDDYLISVYPLSDEMKAMVVFDDDNDEGVSALIPLQLEGYFVEGIREQGQEEAVVVDDESGHWTVTQIADSKLLQGSAVSGEGLPGEVPTEVPPASPAVKVNGTVNGLFIDADPIANTTDVRYYLGTSSGFTIDAAHLVAGPTRATALLVTKDGAGDPLVADQDYYVVAVAENAAGVSPILGEETGPVQLDLTTLVTFFAEEIRAGFILTGRIEIGEIIIDAAQGVTIPTGQGDITFPIDGMSPATFAGFLVAYGLVVQGSAEFYGLSNLLGEFQMASGVPNPSNPPVLSYTHEKASIDYGFEPVVGPQHLYGLCQATASGEWLVAAWEGGNVCRILRVDKTTMALNGTIGPLDMRPFGGITRVGSDFFILGQDTSRSTRYYIYKLNSSYVKVAEIEAENPSLSPADGVFPNRPTIGVNDGSAFPVRVVWCDGNSTISEMDYAASLSAQPSSYTFRNYVSGAHSMGGVHSSNTDVGSDRNFYLSDYGVIYGYTSSISNDPTVNFLRAGGGSAPGQGLWWDGTRFWSLDNAGRIYKYTTHKDETTVKSKFTFYDGNATGSTHETLPGPAAADFVWPARSALKITTSPPPDDGVTDPAQTNKADMAGVYVSQSPSLTAYKRQAYLNPGVRELLVSSFNSGGTDASTLGSNTFIGLPGGTGNFFSEADDVDGPLIDLWGDGHGRVGPLFWGGDGVGSSTEGLTKTWQVTQSATANPNSTSNVTLTGMAVTVDSPDTDAVYMVEIHAEIVFGSAAVNIIELLIDGVAQAMALNTQASAAGNRQSASKKWRITGLSVGNHALTARTRNTAGSTTVAVQNGTTTMTVERKA